MATVSNFPTKPERQGIARDSFPSDLPSDFCTTLTFIGGSAGMASSVITLPLPKRINDQQNIIWEEHSLTDMAVAQLGAGTAVNLASAASGIALNPFMFMLFKRPQFKEHILQWTLSPDTREESDKLKDIIKSLKKASLPSVYGGGGTLMKYPSLVMVTLNPKQYLFPFKKCAIQSVQVDYTGAGLSFFDSTAPTVVNLSLQLKETELWQSDDPELL